MFIPPQTHGALFRTKWDTPACKVCFRRITSQTDRRLSTCVDWRDRREFQAADFRGWTRIRSGRHKL